jgi:hypothetical protein
LGRNDFRNSGSTIYYRATWNGSQQSYDGIGLGGPRPPNGDHNLKWLVLAGCQSLIVADEDQYDYDDQGRQIFSQTWNKIHIILGHNTTTTQYVNAYSFGLDLKDQVPIKEAYFNAATSHRQSALSGEDDSSRSQIWHEDSQQWVYIVDPDNTIMDNDSWTSPKPDINVTWFYAQWEQVFP